MTEANAREYLDKLLTLFPNYIFGNEKHLEYKGSDKDGRIISFSYRNKALALEIN